MLASCVFVIRSLLSSAGRTDRIEAFTQCWADDPNTKFFRNGRKIDIAGVLRTAQTLPNQAEG